MMDFWADWVFPDLPAHLLHQKHLLLESLKGSAPVSLHEVDCWRWGKTGMYTVAQGHAALQVQRPPLLNPAILKQVWDSYGLPKINFFTWVLLHRRVLTGENLEKWGIYGPHRCILCRMASENLDHLFVDFPFSQSVWTHALQGLKVIAPSQIAVNTLFGSWQDRYPRVKL
jgi:hypothetical protein